MTIKGGNDVPHFPMQEPLGQNKDWAFAEKKVGIMSNRHSVKSYGISFEGPQRGHFFQRVRGFFGKIFQNIGILKPAERSNIKVHDRKLEGDGKIKNLFNRIHVNQGTAQPKVGVETPINVDKPMVTFTDQSKRGVETPMNIDKIMATFTELKPESLKQLKSQFVTDNLPNLRTKDMRHLLSVGEMHGIENKEEGEIHLAWAMELIGHLFEEYVGAEKHGDGEMQVLQGILGKLKVGTEFARVLEQKYTINGVGEKALKDAANRLIENIDNSPAIFQVGCEEHCVGLEVERGDDGKVHVRISNVGSGRRELENPERFRDGEQEITAYIPTYEFACEDDTVAEELIFNLMKAFNDEVKPSEMYECFNNPRIDHVRPPEDKIYYRQGQDIGNCAFRNVFEAVYNGLHRNNLGEELFQQYVFDYAKQAVKNGDVYPELQNAAENITPPQFFMKGTPKPD